MADGKQYDEQRGTRNARDGTDPGEQHGGHANAPSRPPLWIAGGFLAAFIATVLTVILTGLYVRGPIARSAGNAATPVTEMRPAVDRRRGEDSARSTVDASARSPDSGNTAAARPPSAEREGAERLDSAERDRGGSAAERDLGQANPVERDAVGANPVERDAVGANPVERDAVGANPVERDAGEAN